jgi:hypothetical protein
MPRIITHHWVERVSLDSERDGELQLGGRGKPHPLKPPPLGGQTRFPNPLGNFGGLILGIALGATRGEAELELDWDWFGCAMGDALGEQ